MADTLKYSICDPFNPEVIEKGEILATEFFKVLDEFPWLEWLEKCNQVQASEIYFSPSLELRNESNSHAISVSLVGDENENEFYLFYKRPKLIEKKSWFKTVQVMEPNFLSERQMQSIDNVRDAFKALIENDFEKLDRNWG